MQSVTHCTQTYTYIIYKQIHMNHVKIQSKKQTVYIQCINVYIEMTNTHLKLTIYLFFKHLQNICFTSYEEIHK